MMPKTSDMHAGDEAGRAGKFDTRLKRFRPQIIFILLGLAALICILSPFILKLIGR